MLASRPRVRLLDPHTINQIAAGEVVERPASVVKELVENSIDAGATRIEIELEETGRRLIRVRDDGHGMSPEDARESLRRHATSKIGSLDDLLAVATMGFRGEAIPSIASVSRFRLSTAEEDGPRFVIEVREGDSLESWEAGPKGTEIAVEDLFYNTPARLKFLKSDASELSAVSEFVSRLALAQPQIAFTLRHEGNALVSTSGSGDLFQAVSEVWGREHAGALVETTIEGPRFRVHGFVSPPHLTRPTRAYQFVYVNRRAVRSRTITAALDQAYRDLTPEKRYPMVALHFDVDPDLIDVNVSPTKSEVKFQHEGLAFDAIRSAVRGGLLQSGMMPDASRILAANEALRSMESPFPGIGAGLGLSYQAADAIPEALLPSAWGDPPEVLSPSRYPFADLLEGLRVIGQSMNTFIIAETNRGLVIIDQHVAHERVIYEYLCGLKGKHAIETQTLLIPQTLTLDRPAALLLTEKLEEVEGVGFQVEPFGGETFVIRSAPAALRGKDPARVLRDLVDELIASGGSRKPTPTREEIWIMSSCKMAVKAGDPLSLAEMEKLIVDLSTTENPYLCPHGRPITATLSKEDLLKKFYRL